MEARIPQPDLSNPPHDIVPGYSDTVLVPVANPSTAADLLHIAGALVEPTHGKIIALSVVEDAEQQAKSVDDVKLIVDRIRTEGYTIEHKTVVSVSISRGILDGVRETGADLLIVGIKQNKRGQVELGTVVENLIETAPCDVMVYRAARTPDFNRVVIPVGSAAQARTAAGIGVRLGQFYRTNIEAMRVQAGASAQFEGLAHIEEALADVQNGHNIKRTVVTANNAADAIVSRTSEDDLIIVGFSERSELERMMFGDVGRVILEKAEGPVIMIARQIQDETKADKIRRRVVSWVRPLLTRTEQEDIVRQSDRDSRLDIDYLALIGASSTIATLGLMLNSAAVIIGAMLVAPLMSPLIALSVGVTVGRVRIAGQALLSVLVGVGFALMVASLAGLLFPITPTPEMNARGMPTLLDAAVAFASGAIGAYATARKDIPAALAGVAIAAALMPPLCTVGLGLALGDTQLAFGAMVLFLTNILCIVLAGVAVFVYLGMTFRRYEDVPIRWQIAATALLILATVPVGAELFILTREVNIERDVRREIQLELPPSAELVSIEFDRVNINRISDVLVVVRSPLDLTIEDTRRIASRLRGRLGNDLGVSVTVLPVIRVAAPEPPPTPEPEPEGEE